MANNYSKKILERIQNSVSESAGVELGKLCIIHNYSVREVAEVFEVSRPTVYNWITGKTSPPKYLRSKIKALVAKLKLRPVPTLTHEDE